MKEEESRIQITEKRLRELFFEHQDNHSHDKWEEPLMSIEAFTNALKDVGVKIIIEK